MTPQEKAKELVETYWRYIGKRWTCIAEYSMQKSLVKECAIIAVDEIISEWRKGESVDYRTEVNYWTQVKQEIESYETESA